MNGPVHPVQVGLQARSASWLSTLPGWLRDVDGSLPVTVHYLLTGNILDRHLMPGPDGSAALYPTVEALWEVLACNDFEALVCYDPSDHLAVHPADSEVARAAAADVLGADVHGRELSLAKLADVIHAVVAASRRIAVVICQGSRVLEPGGDDAGRRALLLRADKLAATAVPPHLPGSRPVPIYNPVFWLLDRERDMPAFLSAGHDTVRTIPVPLPDLDVRRHAASSLSRMLLPTDEARADADAFCSRFAEQTEGMTLHAMIEVLRLARDRDIPPADVEDAVRAYRVGVVDNPWKGPFLRDRIASGEKLLGARVLGQERAIRASLDVLIRSATGLTGAHASGHAARPRGVLFFAGPTGVGKTELAKALTALVFGDEQACTRFDMSEFASEHSEARLIGAPPGYVGHDAGGQLTDAVRRRPFGLLLFDEIDKAHWRILDKFLQILEDGRLTDGSGNTVYFSESLLVFTSNLGMKGQDPAERLLAPDTSHPVLREVVRTRIEHHFRDTLGRPELLRRIGQNIIVFDFVRPQVASRLVDTYLANVRQRVRTETGCNLEISQEIRDRLAAHATADLSLGGAGVGSLLESTFVNPLARAIFLHRGPSGRALRVSRVNPDGDPPLVELAC